MKDSDDPDFNVSAGPKPPFRLWPRIPTRIAWVIRGVLIFSALATLLVAGFMVYGEGMSSFYAKSSYNPGRHVFFTTVFIWAFWICAVLLGELAVVVVWELGKRVWRGTKR